MKRILPAILLSLALTLSGCGASHEERVAADAPSSTLAPSASPAGEAQQKIPSELAAAFEAARTQPYHIRIEERLKTTKGGALDAAIEGRLQAGTGEWTSSQAGRTGQLRSSGSHIEVLRDGQWVNEPLPVGGLGLNGSALEISHPDQWAERLSAGAPIWTASGSRYEGALEYALLWEGIRTDKIEMLRAIAAEAGEEASEAEIAAAADSSRRVGEMAFSKLTGGETYPGVIQLDETGWLVTVVLSTATGTTTLQYAWQ